MEQMRKHLEALALEAVDLEPEDIPTMGKIVNTLSELQFECGDILKPVCKDMIVALQGYMERMILGEAQDVKLVSDAVSCLQAVYRSMTRGEEIREEDIKLIILRLNGSEGATSRASCDILKLEKSDEEEGPEEEGHNTTQRELTKEDIELLRDFVSESLESLSTIEVTLIDLEQNPEDSEIINSIFRPFHTIKGVSGFLSLQKINKLAHCCENLLDKARSGEIRIDETITDLILESVDTLKQLIEAVQKGIETGVSLEGNIDIDPIVKQIEVVHARSEQIGNKPLGEILVEDGVVSKEEVSKALEEQKRAPEKKVGEVLVEKGAAKAQAVASALREQKKFGGGRGTELHVKVDTKKLDTLVDMTGELVIAQSMLRQNEAIVSSTDQKLFQTMSQLNQITSTLQKVAMSMRMVPIRSTFQKMVRLVRDLARSSGKQVQLTMSGEDTEIDRNVVDELYEPMVHMVRNAVDHGIETPEERKAVGKPHEGKVELRAYHQSGNIIIEIEDDGRGLDKERILEKAKEKNLIEAESSLTDSEIYNLIFQPGFSTAKKVTEVSGRGVGMDVVKRSIEKLRGRVEIESRPGRGSTFVIHLPLTLAIIEGMVVRVGEERYIVPTLSILESLKPDRSKYTSVHGRGELIKVRDKLIPLVRFEKVFDISCDCKDPWDGLVVAVEHDGAQFCLLVDEVVGKEEVVIKSLGSSLIQVKGVAGGTILGDGRVALILDMAGICELSSASA